MPRIAKAFERLAAREEARAKITLTIANQQDEQRARQEASGGSDLPKQRIEVEVNPTLIGGWRLEGQESLIDASYKKHLLAIYTAATA